MEKYTKVKSIGKGNMGACTLARNNDDGKYYVIKQVDLTRMSKKDRQQSLNEARVLSSLCHPNIINYVDSFLARRSDNLCIVMEYADGGDLSAKVRKGSGARLPELVVLDWFIQLVLSLQYIHRRKILHRDVKSQNIFLTSDNIIKLGDFGISRTLNNTYDQAQTFVGTPYYLSPELILERPYDHRSDVWALGVVLYEMMTLRHPFNATDMKGLLQRILAVQYEPIPGVYSTDLRNIVGYLLRKDPADRMELSAILELPVVRNRLQEWRSGPNVVPQRYLDSLFKYNLFPSVSSASPLLPDALKSPFQRENESTSSPQGCAEEAALLVQGSGSAPLPIVSPRNSQPLSSARAVTATSTAGDHSSAVPRGIGALDRPKPLMPPLKLYNGGIPPPEQKLAQLRPPGAAPEPHTKGYYLDHLYGQISPSPQPLRQIGRSGVAERHYVRPYVAQSRYSQSPYLAKGVMPYQPSSNIRRGVTEKRRSQALRPSAAALNPLYHPQHQPSPISYSKLAPGLSPPQTDIKAMLHCAAMDRARRRREFT